MNTHKRRCVSCWLLFWRTSLRKYTIFTVQPCGMNSLCTTPLQSKKTMMKPFTFDRTWRFFMILALTNPSIELIVLYFSCHSWFLLLLRPFRANLDRHWRCLTVPEQCSCFVVFAQNFAIVEQFKLPHFVLSIQTICPSHGCRWILIHCWSSMSFCNWYSSLPLRIWK